jgi:translocation and assembly module TamB
MRRALRIGGWTAGVLLCVVVLLVAAVLVAGNTARGRVLIEQLTARLTAGQVRLTGLAGSFPAAIDLGELQLRDAQGVWLTAQHVSLRWSPLALLTHRLDVESLRLLRLDIARLPVSEPATNSSTSTSLPHIDLRQLSIGTLTLGPQLAGAPASLSVEGNAHLKSLKDAVATLVARRTDGNGDYEVTLRFDPASMDATLKLEEPAGGPLENLLQYPGLGALSVTASLHGPRTAERLELTAQAGDLHAHAAGSLDLIHESADLDYRLVAAAMTPRPGLSWQRIALEGQWHGSLSAPQADGRLQISALQIPGGAALTALDADLHADRGALAVHAIATGLVLPGPAPRLLADSPLRVAATVQLSDSTRPVQLDVQHRLFALQAHAVTAGAQSVTFNLRLPELAPLAAIAGENLRGKSELTGTLKHSAAATRLDLTANTGLPEGTTPVSRLLAGASRLELRATLTERSIELERVLLDGRALSVSLSGSGERGATSTAPAVQSLRGRYQLTVKDPAVLSPTLAGTLKLDGEVAGPIDSFATQLQLTSNLSIRGLPRETIQASIKASGLPSRASATLEAHGSLAGAPLQLDTAIDMGAGDTFHVLVHRAQWQSANLQGDLTTAANLASGHGNLHLRVGRMADLQALLGTSLKGSLDGDVTLKSGRSTDVELRVDAQNIGTNTLTADAHLTASGPTDALSLQLAVQSADVGGEPASLETAGRLNLRARELGLQRMQAHYHGQSLQLVSPAQLNFSAGLEIHGLQLAAQRALIGVDGRVAPALDLHASVHQVDAALVNAFVPELLAQGTFDADAELRGTTSAPSGLVTFKATGLRLAGSTARDLAAVDVQATANLTADAARLDAQLSAGRTSQLKLSGTAPLRSNGVLNLKLTGRLDAALANPLLERRGERAAGTLAIDGTVTGTAHAPEIGGTIALTHGDLRDYVQGLHLGDITAQLVAGQGILKIASFTARAPPGQLSMTGTIGVLQPQIPIALRLTAVNAQPIASDLLTSNLGADLKLQGTLRERLELSGTINLNRTVIGIPNAMPPDVAVLDVRRPGHAPPAAPEHKLVIGLDLALHSPREILVQGRGLNAELGGDLHITGTTDNPLISGGFQLIRGTFALAGSNLNFTAGTVSFNGAGLKHKIDPTLDFTAQTIVVDATTTLHITGLSDAPQFELSSTPSLPQDEILARLLFGVSASQLTALQLAQIGVGLATLGGIGGGGPNPLARVQKALGLDRLSVGSASTTGATGTQSTGASLEAGRYISNRVFVGARQSTTGFSQAEVDVDLSQHLKLQTRLGNGTATTQGTTPENDPGSSIGIKYQFEY